jgi:hypothetical protein
MRRTGFTDGVKATAPWVAMRHGRSAGDNDHVHVAVCLVREDGTKASTSNDYRAVGVACRELEERFGLIVVAGREGNAAKWPNRAELEIAQRTAAAEAAVGEEPPERVTVPREELAVMVRAVAAASRDEAEFVRRLHDAGYETRPRNAPGDASGVVGYSVRPIDGDGRWHAGGKLAADLSLPRLRERWNAPATETEADAWRRPTRGAGALRNRDIDDVPPGERDGLEGREWEQVPAEQWQRASEWARVSASEVAAGRLDAGEVAYGAAGIAAALAARLEPRPGPLGGLARELGRYPQPRGPIGTAGETSRYRTAFAVAATVALQASRSGNTMALMALVVELAKLADTLAKLNETRQRLEYARALQHSTRPLAAAVATLGREGHPWRLDPTAAVPVRSSLDLQPEHRGRPGQEVGFER